MALAAGGNTLSSDGERNLENRKCLKQASAFDSAKRPNEYKIGVVTLFVKMKNSKIASCF
jgi:hypothetical protein